MANIFTLDQVIQECLIEKSGTLSTARGKTPGAKMDIYANSWVALNAWIESRLCKSKSASISPFGTFGWELLAKNGETHCRPIFLISDNFVKVYRVRKQRVHRLPTMTPSEEINYSLLAIKYSNNLTKDMIFTGLRDIFKKIGEIVSRGSEVEIEFTIGTFMAKENRTKFLFNQTRLMDILPENLGQGVFATNDRPLKYVEEDDQEDHYSSFGTLPRVSSADSRDSARSYQYTNNNSNNNNKSVPQLDFTSTASSAPKFYDTGIAFGSSTSLDDTISASPAATTPTSSSIPKQGPSMVNATMTNIGSIKILEERVPNRSMNFTDEPNPSEVRKLLDAIAKQSKTHNKQDARNQAKAQVIAQAFDRCLSTVELDAKADESYRYEQMRLQDEYDTKQQLKRQQLQQSSQELNHVLQSQVEAGHTKKLQEQNEQRNAKIQCIVPEPEDHHLELQQRKQTHTKLLLDQIDTHIKQREEAKQERIVKEKAFLSQIAEENDLQLLISRSEQLQRQQELLQAWEQDGHIRNLKKLQTLGSNLIQDYIDRNLMDSRVGLATASSSPAFSASVGSRGSFGSGSGRGGGTPSLGKSFMKSIGYDPRTGKI